MQHTYTAYTSNGAFPVSAFSAWVGPRHYNDLEPDTLAALLEAGKGEGKELFINKETGVVDAYGLPDFSASHHPVRYLFDETGRIIWGRPTAILLMLLRAAAGNVGNLAGKRHTDARVRIMTELLQRKATAAEAGVNALRPKLYELAGIAPASLAQQAAQFTEWLNSQPSPTQHTPNALPV